MISFSIKDLEQLSGIKAHTIRIWEQRYSFLKPGRTQTNIRSYSGDELKMVLNVALLNKYGYRISMIDKMAPDEMSDKIMSLSNEQAAEEQRINALVASMLDMELNTFESLLDEYISQKGIEKAISNIIFPFLEKVGLMWLASYVHPAQEHLVTNIIRRKLIMGIETLPHPANATHSALLFLPTGEYHELGLLFMQYLLKSKGTHVWYLGSNTSAADIAFVIKKSPPAFLYTHLSVYPNLDKFLTKLTAHTGNIPVIISGRATWAYKKKTPSQVFLKKNGHEVMNWIAETIK